MTTAKEAVLANLEIKPITGKTSGSGQWVHTEMTIVVHNLGDDASDVINLVVTFPTTTHEASSTPAGQLVQPVPPTPDPNVPPGKNVVGAMVIPVPGMGVGESQSVTVRFTMTEAGKGFGGSTRVGAFVYGPRPDCNGGNNAASYDVF